jgi:hypothetical protein
MQCSTRTKDIKSPKAFPTANPRLDLTLGLGCALTLRDGRARSSATKRGIQNGAKRLGTLLGDVLPPYMAATSLAT